MKKDIKYIIRRIIIGVGIALSLGFIRGTLITSVMALQVDSYAIGQYSTVIDNTTTSYTYSVSGRPWSSLSGTVGYISGNIGLYKVDGTSTSINVIPLMVYINVGNNTFPCSISSPTLTNSTFNGGTYSYRCPVRMNSNGITSINVQFEPIQSNFPSNYRLSFGSLISYEVIEDGDVNVNVDTNGVISESQTQGNATRNTINNSANSINNNQNQNTQNIINNQNQNTQQQIESQKVCSNIVVDRTSIEIENSLLNNTGNIGSSNSHPYFGITKYVPLSSSSYIIVNNTISSDRYMCFYDSNYTLISCLNEGSLSASERVAIPQNSSYVRFTISNAMNIPIYTVFSCQNGNQAIKDSVNDLNNTINNDTVDTGQANGFFSNFTTNSHGLSGIITAPLRLLNSFTTATCSPLQFNLPFLHDEVSLPCMRGIYEDYFGVFFSLWQLITTGLISYNICINLYSKVRNLQNPNNDRIEVLNL